MLKEKIEEREQEEQRGSILSRLGSMNLNGEKPASFEPPSLELPTTKMLEERIEEREQEEQWACIPSRLEGLDLNGKKPASLVLPSLEPPKRCSLLYLPAEIRHMIWAEVLCDYTIHIGDAYQDGKTAHTAIAENRKPASSYVQETTSFPPISGLASEKTGEWRFEKIFHGQRLVHKWQANPWWDEGSTRRCKVQGIMGLLGTNRAIRQEAIKLFYSRNTFNFIESTNMSTFFQCITYPIGPRPLKDEHVGWMRNVRVENVSFLAGCSPREDRVYEGSVRRELQRIQKCLPTGLNLDILHLDCCLLEYRRFTQNYADDWESKLDQYVMQAAKTVFIAGDKMSGGTEGLKFVRGTSRPKTQ